jgi:hypothetical protein
MLFEYLSLRKKESLCLNMKDRLLHAVPDDIRAFILLRSKYEELTVPRLLRIHKARALLNK